ncbi:fibronectin type III domain-containing protein, partial [Glycomyces salinus]|uniref:fibronectin type III domain-containing protein n=1 Tax=Glycomyces salinus TaxID=980294 RepID=UPI0018ED2FF4
VVSSDGTAQIAEKDRDDILGGNAPPEDDNDEGSGDDDEGDGDEDGGEEIGPPGAVTNLVGAAGDGKVTLSWDAAPNNGSALTKYVIEGAGDSWEISPSQRVLEIGDLDNGESYNFTVTAHNSEGAGDTATSPSVVPSADVPGVVENVEATANPDGTVEVAWDEADGEGNDVTGYRVEAVSGEGDRTVVGQADGTELVTADGDLNYGVHYSFSVTTLAGDAAAEPSEPSDSVTPFNVPDAPTNLLAESSSSAAGTIDVTWNQPASNGRKIEKYIVSAGDQTKEVTETSASMEGFGNNENVAVTVVAVNEAGESDPASTTSNTMSKPTVQVQNHSSTAKSITLNLTYDDGGGEVTCDLLRDGAVKVNNGSCDSLTEGGLRASTEHIYQVRITNAAGNSKTSNYKASTKAVKVTVHFECDDPAGDPYCDGTDSDRISIRKGASHDTAEVGATGPGKTFNASCYTTGDKISPRGNDGQGVFRDYHKNKNDSNIWVLVPGQGGYIPFVWLRVDGAGVNGTGDLPKC